MTSLRQKFFDAFGHAQHQAVGKIGGLKKVYGGADIGSIGLDINFTAAAIS